MNKKTLFIFFIATFIFSCRGDRSKAEHDDANALWDNRLVVEVYKISSGGAYGGDRVSEYLTDSTNFRKYIGTFDNAHGGYSYKCKGDSVYIYEVEQSASENKILSVRGYSIQRLKGKRIFE